MDGRTVCTCSKRLWGDTVPSTTIFLLLLLYYNKRKSLNPPRDRYTFLFWLLPIHTGRKIEMISTFFKSSWRFFFCLMVLWRDDFWRLQPNAFSLSIIIVIIIFLVILGRASFLVLFRRRFNNNKWTRIFPFFLDHLTLNNSTHLYSTKHPFKIRVHRIIQPYYINSSCSFFRVITDSRKSGKK